MSKADKLAHALDDFLAVSPEVEAAAVVSSDGLPMASALPPSVEEDRLAAMSAALLTLGERAAEGLGKGDLAQVFVEGAHGHVVLTAAGSDAVLVTVTARAAKVGLVLFEMRRTAGAVARIMASGAPAMFDDGTADETNDENGRAAGSAGAQSGRAAGSAGAQSGQIRTMTPPRAPEPTPAAEAEPQVSNWQ